ncbi:MurR/RpiR family transcriptional regulator [Miniphocaeibacter halophilus]|uniref:MurR/RpiR family transcriptional regulator n=1 Tax=Miniphocaeibacter halophilus TaxID=2931922 RepID=A0AC61MS05_9FIRM|nr:MurR/RpiR family transcriptional regulator [Miniphocaeibacter halophilus]QQK07201.1 MurR/RpiR family transcriptional regulator [Miniphocaeibacter halophilus]
MEGKHIHNRIASIVKELPNSEQKIGNFVLESPEKVITMSASKLAKATNTSPATVMRFCKSIGIPSFTDLKIKLSAEIELPSYSSYTDISPNESISEIKNKLLSNAYRSMEETIQILDDRIVKEVVEVIKKASIIYVFGIGASNLVAENIAQKWNRIGKTTISLLDSHQVISALISGPKDVVFIGISNSGETDEVLRIVRIAKKRKIKTIGISQFGNNSLNQEVDISVKTVKSKEAEIRSAATSSLLIQFMAIDILFYAYVAENYEDNIKKIRETKKAIDEYKDY